jgi:hypothetical protein
MERNLLEVFTPNLPEETNSSIPNFYEVIWNAANPERKLGAVMAQMGFRNFDRLDTFVAYSPHTAVTSRQVEIYGSATASDFAFSNRPLPAWQIHFLREFALLAKNHGCKLVLLHIPIMDEKGSAVINESAYWPGVMQTDVAMFGIPTKKLFSGMTDPEIKLLFSNAVHLNQNGMEYFTPLIFPALLKLYESQQHD